jgi:hypothetical protein
MSHRERGEPTAGVMVGLVEKPSERKLIMASPGAIEGPSLLRQHCDRAASDIASPATTDVASEPILDDTQRCVCVLTLEWAAVPTNAEDQPGQ